MNAIAARVMSTVAGQLGHPHGPLGKVVAVVLNRANRRDAIAAVDAAAVESGATVADIGFGGGAGMELLLGRVGSTGVVYGIDISADMVNRARSRFDRQVDAGTLRLLEGSLNDLPLDDSSLDAIITVNTIYFIPDLDEAFAELARVLRPDGRAVICIGDPAAMAKLPFTPYGFRLRPVDEVIAELERAGLTVDRREVPVGLVPGHLLIATRP
ncbi:methyltransferase domain-containing protein [Nocardia sp. NPDC051756]|uniref:class I SAM-dependent methyltransferase n=1 Tax=Nocardia sp. NPDC051756 TaxID=3154751 RepID=UPI00343881BD